MQRVSVFFRINFLWWTEYITTFQWKFTRSCIIVSEFIHANVILWNHKVKSLPWYSVNVMRMRKIVKSNKPRLFPECFKGFFLNYKLAKLDREKKNKLVIFKYQWWLKYIKQKTVFFRFIGIKDQKFESIFIL